MERISITDENVDDLLEKFGDEWWTGREILASFAKIQRHYLVDWSKDGRLRRMEIIPRPQRGSRFLYNVGDAIIARHQMRECKPFLNKIGPDGERVFRCNDCGEWKKVHEFHRNYSAGRGPGMHTHCKACHAIRNKKHREGNVVEILKSRERARRRRRQTVARAKAVAAWERKNEIDPTPVIKFLDESYADVADGVLSERCGAHPDLIRKVRRQAREGRKIKFATADTILTNLGGGSVLGEIIAEMEKDRPVWHPKHAYCSRCMRTSVPHEAAGMCQTCYPRRNDPDYVPIMEGQWARRHTHCKGCGTTERRHYGHGLCRRCWQRARAASKVGSGHGMDGQVQAQRQAGDDGGGGRPGVGRIACHP